MGTITKMDGNNIKKDDENGQLSNTSFARLGRRSLDFGTAPAVARYLIHYSVIYVFYIK